MTRDLESKVSIILPTYNGASGFLHGAIASCLNQTHRNLELIVVDDGSTDHTGDVVKSFRDPRIRYIRHESNKRLPRALNTGFQASTGEFLTWTSDDNEYLPDAVQRMVACLCGNGGADFVYADYYVLHTETGSTELHSLPDRQNLPKKNSVGPCFLYTRAVLRQVGDYDPRLELVEDYDYWMRVADRFEMVRHRGPLYVYREHPASLTRTRNHSVVLFDSILKFQRHHYSTRQLARAVREFCASVLRSERSVKQAAVVWLHTLQRIFAISRRLGFLFVALTLAALGRRVLLLFVATLGAIAERLVEPWRFVRTVRRLRRAPGQRNILCLFPALAAGGAPAVMLNVARGLGQTGQTGYCFHILTANRSDNSWRERFGSVFTNVLWLGPACTDERYYKYARALVARLRIDLLLLSNSEEGYRCLPRLSKAFPSLKVVDVLHAENWVGTRDEDLRIAPYIHRRVCVSQRLKNYMLSRYQAFGIGAPHDRNLEVIHNGIDTQHFSRRPELSDRFKARFDIREDIKVISFVGRFSSEKRPLLFVDIAEEVLLRTPGARIKFVMAGNGEQFHRVEERIASSQLRHAFVLTGLIDGIAELLADTHLLMVVSDSEGLPLVIPEAMAAGVPVISTDVGAINEIISDGRNGYLISSSDQLVERFASYVVRLLEDNELYAALSLNARDSVVPKYSLETMAHAYAGIFNELAAETTEDEQDNRRAEPVAGTAPARQVSISAGRRAVRTLRP
jgi:glycosyltransferase involved in cell wall biosynthesis